MIGTNLLRRYGVVAGDRNQGPAQAGGVYFDGSTYIERGADLTGVADGKVGTFVARVRYHATLTKGALNISIPGGHFQIGKLNNAQGNKLFIGTTTSGGVTAVFNKTTNGYTDADGYLNLCFSWDATTYSKAQMYVNDVDDAAAATAWHTYTADYTNGDYYVGFSGSPGFATSDPFDIVFQWLDLTAAMDFSDVNNRRLFFDATGAVQNFGANGETPTGSSPILFQAGDYTTWEDNLGTGGAFTTTTGALAAITP